MAQLAIHGNVSPAESEVMDSDLAEAFLDAVGEVKQEEAEADGEQRQKELEFIADVVTRTGEGIQQQLAQGFSSLAKRPVL